MTLRATLAAALALRAFDAQTAQRRMAPADRGPVPDHLRGGSVRPAASLAYCFESKGEWLLPVTVRREDLPEHRGQPCLPGGRPHADESLWATALREAQEEVGLDPQTVVPLGQLAPVYIPPTHTDLTVCVAYGPDPRPLKPAEREVERLVYVRLGELCDPARRAVHVREIAGRSVEVPCFDVEGIFLWGATAMALMELAERLSAVRHAPGSGGQAPAAP